MYSAQDLKNELLINLKTDPEFSEDLINSLNNSEFEFNDSYTFSKREWNTYTRELKIFCCFEDKLVISNLKKELYQYVDKLHGKRDEFYIMDLMVFIKMTDNESIGTENEIIITNKVIISKKDDYIGNGGFAIIYKKKDFQTGVDYAYKVFDPSPFHGSEPEIMKKRFLREAKKLLSYSHENIVHAYDFGFLNDDSAYIKMEYIDGDDLFKFIEESSLGEKDKECLAIQYISAMAYIHEKMDIHRDISYSNIMVTKDNKIKVLDFGFSRNDEDTVYDTVYADILHKFCPPDSEYTIRSEVYCIGAVLFTILSGEKFHESKITMLERLSLEKKYKLAIAKCLETNPELRFSNAIELKDFLNNRIPSEGFNNNFIDSFTLDNFKDLVENIRSIKFDYGCLPTQSLIKDWVGISFREIIQQHKFLSKLNFIQLLYQLPNSVEVIEHNDVDADIDKNIVIEIYQAYSEFDDKDKDLLINGIYTVVMSRAWEDEMPF